MTILYLKAEPRNGEDLPRVFAEMIALARRSVAVFRMDVGVACEVNGMPLHAHADDTVEDVRRLYDLMRGEGPRREEHRP